MGNDEFPLAYFITWTTYGSWLPGDERGWVKRGERTVQPPDPLRREAAAQAMSEDAVVLSPAQRSAIDAMIARHCAFRGWILHARNARTNHVHVVASAAATGETMRSQLKSWCSRALSEQAGLVGRGRNGQRRWWTEGGDVEWIDNDESLSNVIQYVNELQ